MKIGIVGGGLSGTSIAKICFEKNIEFDWFIDSKPNASEISSGIINPITGRNLVLTWHFQKFLDAALNFYKDPENTFILPIDIEKHIHDPVLFKDIFLDLEHRKEWISIKEEGVINIKNSFQVKIPEFITNWQTKLESYIIKDPFEYLYLEIKSKIPKYKGEEYDAIIFCEGIEVLKNPFFKHLPFIANRGEALEIESDTFEFKKVVHRGKMLCKFKNNYWIGSTFDRVPTESPLKTETVLDELKSHANQFFQNVPFQVLQHLGALRCTVRDRRPIVDRHPMHSNLIIFNGFGTKGSSLIPFFAENIISHLLYQTELDPEVSINRFKEFRKN